MCIYRKKPTAEQCRAAADVLLSETKQNSRKSEWCDCDSDVILMWCDAMQPTEESRTEAARNAPNGHLIAAAAAFEGVDLSWVAFNKNSLLYTTLHYRTADSAVQSSRDEWRGDERRGDERRRWGQKSSIERAPWAFEKWIESVAACRVASRRSSSLI